MMGLALVFAGSARADLMENATETMLEDQAMLVGLLGYNFGPDPSSPLHFNYSINSTTGNFSYASDSPTYLGQPVSVSDTATFDGVNTYTMSGNITLGANSYATSASGVLSTLMDGSTQLALDVTVAAGPGIANDKHTIAVWINGRSYDYGYYTYFGFRIPFSDFVSRDYIQNGILHNTETPTYAPPTLTPWIVTDGDANGFTSTVYPSPVPEPSSLAVAAACGLLGLVYRGARHVRTSR